MNTNSQILKWLNGRWNVWINVLKLPIRQVMERWAAKNGDYCLVSLPWKQIISTSFCSRVVQEHFFQPKSEEFGYITRFLSVLFSWLSHWFKLGMAQLGKDSVVGCAAYTSTVNQIWSNCTHINLMKWFLSFNPSIKKECKKKIF